MKKNLYLNIFIFQAIIVFLTSCVNQKQIAYFQKGVNQTDTIAVAKAYVPKIQPGDILSITVGSLNPMASSFFNPYSTMAVTGDNGSGGGSISGSGGGTSGSSQAIAPGFLVDSAGTIEFPLIGILKVAGLNTSELREIIKKQLTTYLKEPTVNVRLLNYKIAIMGEVNRPSVYIIPNEKVTLPEALSIAGDLTIYAKRENILVVRDINGKKEFGRVNLNNRDVFTSPYYYLHSGDLIYVEQGKGKIAQGDAAYRIIPIIISALTLAVLFLYKVDN